MQLCLGDDEFLKRFSLESLDQLPDYEELLARLQMIEAPTKPEQVVEGDTLYNHFEVEVAHEVAPEGVPTQEQTALEAAVAQEETFEEELPDFLKGEELVAVGDIKELSSLEKQAKTENKE